MSDRVEKIAIALISSLITGALAYALYAREDSKKPLNRATTVCENGVLDLIGDTPMIHLRALSRATNRRILAKVEFANPGGSTKDRVCLAIINDALEKEELKANGTVYEGTVGSTGISLALVARAKGLAAHVCMPDDQAQEKAVLLHAFGARVEQVRPLSIVDGQQYVKLAEKRAHDDPHGFFANQFENLVNARAHYLTTGTEIWEQTKGRLDGFVAGAGTGGTIAGISTLLKEKSNGRVRVVLVDPPGSGLKNKVQCGVMYSDTEAEGQRTRHQVDTVTEGVGINRVTRNFSRAQVDDAVSASDAESVHMSRYLMRHEALFVGSSSALCCVGAVKLAMQLPPGSTVVTILCDSGQRHLTKFWNDEYLASQGITIDQDAIANKSDLSFLDL